ncbi:MAG: hypothetical protein Q9183_004148 [Haloplaca sp. 2 TL-2023]
MSLQVVQNIDDQLNTWQTLHTDIQAGKEVYAPQPSNAKKRAGTSTGRFLKKLRKRDGSGVPSHERFCEPSSDEHCDLDEVQSGSVRGLPLTAATITAKISELQERKVTAQNSKSNLQDQLDRLRSQRDGLRQERADTDSDILARCILARNDYSREAIQQDYAAGIREIDEELAAQEDEANFNPGVELRDYDEIARNFPHCVKLTENGRMARSRKVLNEASRVVTSLTLSLLAEDNDQHLTTGRKIKEEHTIEELLDSLNLVIVQMGKDAIEGINQEMSDSIFDKYESAVSSAVRQAMPTVQKWAMPVNKPDRPGGGYYYGEYKAICRRNGKYSNLHGDHEWNEELLEPMLRIIRPAWERTFSRRVPEILNCFSLGAIQALTEFHQQIHNRAQELGRRMEGLTRLGVQLEIWQEIFKNHATELKAAIKECQKNENREFVPVICATLATTYQDCASQQGAGCFKRMKDIMHTSIDRKRRTMFQSSANEVKGRLEIITRRQGKVLQDKLKVAMQGIRHDYTTVFGTLEGKSIEAPNPDSTIRDEVKTIFDEYEVIFRRLAEDSKGQDGTDEVAVGLTVAALQEDLNDGMEIDALQSEVLTANHYTIPEGQSPTDEMRIDGPAAASVLPFKNQATSEVRPKKEQG